MNEQELREQIAQEIEAEMNLPRGYDALASARNRGLKRAAFIVRGKGDSN